MDDAIEQIRRLSQQARHYHTSSDQEAALDREMQASNRPLLRELETSIPRRLRQLADASDGWLTVEDSAFKSQAATAIRLAWGAGEEGSHTVELWLLRESGGVEWRWTMGYREAPIVHRVPASRFDLARLDALVVALADPERWRGGYPPEV